MHNEERPLLTFRTDLFVFLTIPWRSIGQIAWLLALFILAGCAGASEGTLGGERPPNIVLILTDDQGCGDVAFTGNDELATPNLSRLAGEGVRFSQFYVAPVCAPTRAGLLTGRYHQRTGVLGVIEGREFMVEAETTIAELLSEAGYATGIFGKWHLGENYPWTPYPQGFDEFIGFRDGSHPYFNVMLEHNGRPYPTQGYLTDVLTDQAINFMENHRDAPFFLYLPYNAPHSPLEAPEKYIEPYRHLPQHTALIYGMMASVDENVGRLLGALDDLDLSEKTLVFFLSDNGPLYGGGEYQQAERFNCGLRGTKYSVYEGGMRVPLVVRGKDHALAGKTVDTPAAYIDLFPTILEYAGLPIPDSLRSDGRSLVPLVEGDTASWPERLLFMSYPGEAGQRTRAPAPYPGGMAVDGRYKMVNGTELYDLDADPGETNNLAGEKPDVLKRLDAAYLRFWQEVTAGRTPYPRVQVGHPEENPAVLTAHWARLTDGLQFQFSEDPPRYRGVGVHGDWIARWGPEGRAVWRLDVQADARYRIAARVRCAAPGARLRAEIAGASIESLINGCSAEEDAWLEQELGVAPLRAGEADLSLSVSQGGDDLILKEVMVERLRD